MTAQSSTIDLEDEFVPTPLDLARDRVGGSLVKLAERVRMLGQRIEGSRPQTDAEAIRSHYDWGFKIGRDQALRTLVGDEAAKAVVRAVFDKEDVR